MQQGTRSFSTHSLEGGYDIRTIQELIGHKDVSAMMIYKGGHGVKSPVDMFIAGLD